MDGDTLASPTALHGLPARVLYSRAETFPAFHAGHLFQIVTDFHAGFLRWMAAFPDSRQKALKGMKDWNWEPLVNLVDLQEVRTGVPGSFWCSHAHWHGSYWVGIGRPGSN